MRAAVFYDVGDIRLEDVPEPEIGDEDVLVEVLACGICGSDLEYYTGRSPVGTDRARARSSSATSSPAASSRAARTPTACRRATASRSTRSSRAAAGDFSRSGNPHFDLSVVLGVTTNGGFAKLVKTKAEHAYKLPDSMSDEQGAFVEMLAASLNAVEKAQIRLGDVVVIYGPGPVGLSMVQLAKASGGRVVMVGTRDYRLELAKGMGADHVFNIADSSSPHHTADLAASIREVNAGDLAERAIVATASEDATQSALDVTGNGSTIVYMGLAGPERHRQGADAREPRHGQDDPLLAGSTRTSGRTRSGCCARASSTPPRSSRTRSSSTRSTRASSRCSRARTASSRSS